MSMDFHSYWSSKADSGGRFDDDAFYELKAGEHAALMTEDERWRPTVDLGVGGGELLGCLRRHCHVVEALDYSESMLTQARTRIGDSGMQFRCMDAFEYLPASTAQIWMSCGGLNQYLDQRGQLKIIRLFAENRNAISLFLFDTIDPDRYRLLQERGLVSYHETPALTPFQAAYRRLRALMNALTRDYSAVQFNLGEMGYAFRPRLWLEAARESGLSCELLSSRYYEYRYHVILRKTPRSGGGA